MPEDNPEPSPHASTPRGPAQRARTRTTRAHAASPETAPRPHLSLSQRRRASQANQPVRRGTRGSGSRSGRGRSTRGEIFFLFLLPPPPRLDSARVRGIRGTAGLARRGARRVEAPRSGEARGLTGLWLRGAGWGQGLGRRLRSAPIRGVVVTGAVGAQGDAGFYPFSQMDSGVLGAAAGAGSGSAVMDSSF